MTTRLQAFTRYQRDTYLFSRDIIRIPLHAYQHPWADYVVEVVSEGRNETIVVEMPRQSGKNETSAQLECMIMAKHARTGGHMVKTAPTWKPQIVNSKDRLEKRAALVEERLSFLKFRGRAGYIIECGRCGLSFLSAQPTASVVGDTANLLMEIDEAQDVDKAKYDKDFAPMRASTGAPVVAYGTTWTDDTLLERFKADVLEGRTRGKVVRISPDTVAESNPAYGEFVDGEVSRLGRQHPLVKTQYYLEPLETRGRLLTDQQLRLMAGQHRRQSHRTDQVQVVAGLDFAGADEEAGTIEALLKSASARDSVALTIGEVTWARVAEGMVEPQIRILDRYEWVNQHPTSLHGQLYDIVWNRWRVDRIHCDATGIGETGTRFLEKAINRPNRERVHGVTFDSAWKNQTRLATNYVALVLNGRLRDYAAAGFSPLQAAHREAADLDNADKHVWWQRGHAKLEARQGRRAYRIYVPDSEGHDDLIVAEMLMVDAAHELGTPARMQTANVDWDRPPQKPEPVDEGMKPRSEVEVERILEAAGGTD